MTEAVERVLDFFFCEIQFNRVYAYLAHENPASGRVMQKCGMNYEGTMRQACLCNRGVFDRVNYAILAEDYIIRVNRDITRPRNWKKPEARRKPRACQKEEPRETFTHRSHFQPIYSLNLCFANSPQSML